MAARGRQPNELLRRARGTRSQAALAELANTEIYRRTNREGALTAKSISDLERGWYSWPVKATRDALCAVLGASDPSELGFVLRRGQRTAAPYAWAPPADAVAANGRPADLAAIHAVSASLQSADRQLGGGHLYPAVVGYLRAEIAPQLTSASADHTAGDLFAAAASFSEIAGWMSHDGGHDQRAERHFTQALRLARASDDAGVAGNIQASMSHLAVHLDRHDAAVQLAEGGIGAIHDGYSHQPLLARLHAMRARGLAGLGYAQPCLAALSRAERALDSARDAPVGEWISHFDAASLATEVAWCLHRLGDLTTAEEHALTAIELRSGDRVRSRSFAQLALAQILFTNGRIEEAAHLGGQVRAIAATLTSARVRTQLVDLAARLAPCHDSPAVAEFLASMAAVTTGPTLIEESS